MPAPAGMIRFKRGDKGSKPFFHPERGYPKVEGHHHERVGAVLVRFSHGSGVGGLLVPMLEHFSIKKAQLVSNPFFDLLGLANMVLIRPQASHCARGTPMHRFGMVLPGYY